MSTPQQKVKRSRAHGDSPPVALMLDAYVDQSSASPSVQDDRKGVNKKNKNKKKREQREDEEKRRQSESNSQPPEDETDEVIDSWEEISAADAPQLPKSAIKIESPPKKVDTPKKSEAPTKTEASKKSDNPQSKKNDGGKKSRKNVVEKKADKNIVEQMAGLCLTQDKSRPVHVSNEVTLKMLADLQSTMNLVSELFKNPPAIKAPIKDEAMKVDENSREDIQGEREAKKQAAAATKQSAASVENKILSQGTNSQKDLVQNSDKKSNPQKVAESSAMEVDNKDEKSRDEIKAEREAKKLAKALAKQGVKPKTGSDDVTTGNEAKKQETETSSDSGKSKADLKAERRAKQEAQRAAKEAQQKNPSAGAAGPVKPDAVKVKVASQPSAAAAAKPATLAKSGPLKSQRVSDDIQADRPSVEKKRQRMLASQQIPPRTKAQKKVLLFKHLHQYERELSVTRPYPIVGAHIHPSVLQLGLQYSEGTIQGSNARCVALLHTLKKVILEYETPDEKEFSRDLDAKLKLYISFLKECRTHSVSMGNAIRTIKSKITSLESGVSDSDAKNALCETIDEFCQNVKLAPASIAEKAVEKIRDGDVILTYGCSSLLRTVLIKAAETGLKFRVIVADGRPKLEGREMARHLVNANIHTTYIHISAIAHIIKEVTKVFLGAHAVLANGFVMSRVGTSQISLIAKAHNVPVMVCCETYKFSERVQTDSFVFNELGDPDDLVATGTKTNPLEDWRDLKHLCLLNLTYDFTPANLVDAIISEISVIPCTSVPVVLRLKKDDLS